MPACLHRNEDDVCKLVGATINISPQSSDCKKEKKKRESRKRRRPIMKWKRIWMKIQLIIWKVMVTMLNEKKSNVSKF